MKAAMARHPLGMIGSARHVASDRCWAEHSRYKTNKSMYNVVRRFGKVRYNTLHLLHKVTTHEANGSVKFGADEGSAYLFDLDIYTDGRISVHSIDIVLFLNLEDEGGCH